MLINAEFQIIQFRGATSAYLVPPTGKASFDLLKMAREGLMLPLRTAINEANKENQTVRRGNVLVEQNGGTEAVTIRVVPLKNLKERCFLIPFEPVAGPQAGQPLPTTPPPKPLSEAEDISRVAALERDLAETRDYLQSLQERIPRVGGSHDSRDRFPEMPKVYRPVPGGI